MFKAKIVFFISFLLGHLLMAQAPQAIQVDGSINPGSADYIIQNIEKANKEEAPYFVILLNTPGGLLSSTRSIIEKINESKIPVLVYVTPKGGRATSAGALISLAAPLVVMDEGTNMGAAHPVGPGGESPKGAMEDKAVQDTSAMARSQAQMNERNLELAEKIVTESLSFTAEEAFKKGLIDGVVKDKSEIHLIIKKRLDFLKKRGLKTEQLFNAQGEIDTNWVVIPMSNKQKFLHAIADPNVSTLLLSLAGLAIYTEISSGFTLVAPGVLGLLLLILGFVSLQMIPITTGGGALIILGFALLVAELFVTSFGLLAIAGVGSLLLGSLFLVDPQLLGLGVSPQLIGGLFFASFTIIGSLGYLIWKESRQVVKSGLESLIGEQAQVTQVVHESGVFRGTLQIHGEIWNFESDEKVEINQMVVLLNFQGEGFKIRPLKI